jgi:hypothetical protein
MLAALPASLVVDTTHGEHVVFKQSTTMRRRCLAHFVDGCHECFETLHEGIYVRRVGKKRDVMIAIAAL